MRISFPANIKTKTKINKFEMTKAVGAMHAQTQGLATGSGEVVVIVVPRIGSAGANLTAPALLTRTLLPSVRRAEGTFVFVNSSAGLAASPEWSAYAASKFGLRALADSLRAEEVDHGVRVTTVFPSRTATPMQEKVHEQEGATYDASKWIPAGTVADTILHVLDLPAGTTIPEVTVRPVVPRR